LSCGFYLSSSSSFSFSSPNLSGRRLDVYHTWCGPSANLQCRSEMCCMWFAGNAGPKKLPKIRHLGTIAPLCLAISSQLRHVSTIGKKVLNSNAFPTCAHNIVNFCPLTARIRGRVWGTPANFNGFRVLPPLLERSRSPEANQTLHDVWPSPGLVHYIFGGSCPLTEFCPVQYSLYVQVLRSHILAALLHGTRTVGVSETLRH